MPVSAGGITDNDAHSERGVLIYLKDDFRDLRGTMVRLLLSEISP